MHSSTGGDAGGASMKWWRDYFEDGCLCILRNATIAMDKSESDEAAVARYMAECVCSRHPELGAKP